MNDPPSLLHPQQILPIGGLLTIDLGRSTPQHSLPNLVSLGWRWAVVCILWPTHHRGWHGPVQPQSSFQQPQAQYNSCRPAYQPQASCNSASDGLAAYSSGRF